jgi:O-antigen ligase
MILKMLKFNLFKLNNIIFLSLLLIPVFLVRGKFFADFLVVLMCIIFLLKQFIEKKFFLNTVFFKVFFIFWILISLRSLFAEDIYFSLKSSLPFIRFAIFALAIQYLIQDNPKRIFILFFMLAILLFIVAADGIFQNYMKTNILGYPLPTLKGRISGFFKDELIIGSYVSRFMPILIGMYFYCKYLKLVNKNFDKFLIIFIIYLFFLTLLSGERVAIFYCIISLLSFLFLIRTKRIIKIFLLVFIIIASTLFIAKSERTKERLIYNVVANFGISNNQESYDKQKFYMFSIQHHNHIIAAYKIFKENILFGAGVKMFRKICEKRYSINEHSCTTHPHNIIMQFLSETGIIGSLFYIVSLCYVLLKLFKIFKINMLNLINDHDRSQFFFLIALLISLFPIFPSGNFFTNWIGIISFFSAGFYLATLKRKDLDV